MSPGSNTESYPAFAHIGLRENPEKTSTRTEDLGETKTKRRGETLLPKDGDFGNATGRKSSPPSTNHVHKVIIYASLSWHRDASHRRQRWERSVDSSKPSRLGPKDPLTKDSQDKKTELAKVLFTKQVDVFGIMEANICNNQKKYFSIKGYTTYLLLKGRQIASGMLIGVRNNLTSNFKIMKEMNETDKIEIAYLDLWRSKEHFSIYFVYNPPNNSPDLNIFDISHKTIIMGDFNAHSKLWGYRNQNTAGKAMEDWLNTNELELVFNRDQEATYMHHTGSTFNPDLLLVASNIAERTHCEIYESLGSDHRVVIASIKVKAKPPKVHCKKSWNFKKLTGRDTKVNWKTDYQTRSKSNIAHQTPLITIYAKF
ncbi:hypothetical protein ANN_24736 [Periplaneta americana]|uniref:Endonuclease/exonuclease/phosphatase domain-containing protein n=1 Tax=Periplaneta americana TaxID=6978 RepID=A0ABQ8RZR5_PERAM|nr:hypothetical protein ANN_24736 [Periplaneta americana]